MDQHEKLQRARAQVQAMTVFYFHLAIFVVVLAVLFIINASVGKAWWVQWVLIGWGTFVAAHAVAVFANIPNAVRAWQLRKIKELADKM